MDISYVGKILEMSQVQWLCKLPGDVAARNAIQSLKHYYEVELPELLANNTLVPLNP
jgi:hypothetical protein